MFDLFGKLIKIDFFEIEFRQSYGGIGHYII
jgi:hypothetical protein